MLSLKYSEACIWRPYTGCNILLVRTGGLDRLHNADTVSGALRYRGINRLHGMVLLDVPPPDGGDAATKLPELIPDYSAPLFYPGQAVPDNWDLDWLPASDGTAGGARLAMGGREIWLVWELAPGTCHCEQKPDTMVLTTDVYCRLDAQQRHKLHSLGNDIRVVGESSRVETGMFSDVFYSPEEISIRPSDAGMCSSMAVAGVSEP